MALNMPGNGFKSVPLEIGELQNLASLDLSENFVERLDGNILRTLESLEELNLSHNNLTELNGVVLPSKLQTFHVQNNQVRYSKLEMSKLFSKYYHPNHNLESVLY